jgi:glucose-6-phosphate dehydrogenase assembly protein OpcA
MTEENTGIINNLVEIAKDYNIYGVSDKNSTPANKAQGENDIGSADTIILIRTGEALIYTSVIITTVILGAIVAFMAYTKLVSKKRKGGV